VVAQFRLNLLRDERLDLDFLDSGFVLSALVGLGHDYRPDAHQQSADFLMSQYLERTASSDSERRPPSVFAGLSAQSVRARNNSAR